MTFKKLFLGTSENCENKKLSHFASELIILRCLGQEGLIKFFSWDFH